MCCIAKSVYKNNPKAIRNKLYSNHPGVWLSWWGYLTMCSHCLPTLWRCRTVYVTFPILWQHQISFSMHILYFIGVAITKTHSFWLIFANINDRHSFEEVPHFQGIGTKWWHHLCLSYTLPITGLTITKCHKIVSHFKGFITQNNHRLSVYNGKIHLAIYGILVSHSMDIESV